MKKTVLFLLVILCVTSCKNSTFTITGSVENKGLNGKTIFLKQRINREWKTMDSTVVENLKFTFKGASDTAKIAYLAYEYPTGNKIRQAFVLESGNVTAAIDTSGFMIIKGTKQNDLLQTYQDEKNSFNKKTSAFYKLHIGKVETPEQKMAFSKDIEKLNQEEINIDKKFALENVNTLVGTHVFMNSFYGYSIPEKESIVNVMNVETKNIKRVQEIIADMEVEKKVAVGSKFIDIKLPGIAGDSIALSDLVGKTDFVLVDFWASWCGPCMQFLPELQSFYAKHKGASLEILGVSLDDSKEAWTSTVASKKINWKLVSDLKGWKCAGSRAYAVNSIPATVLIDKSGKIVGKNLSIPEMEKLLLGNGTKK
ncbi:MAG: TlpA disulfide reductase family protein [Paludibacter sp.]|nr:TlpA disulfide reductase family protein [Paludibacter sp.]